MTMPISPIVLQRRHAELGRIRLGAKRGGSGAPMKLESFRFTSASESYIKDLAELYGGDARAWDNGGKPEFEVFTDAKSIPVIAVKGGLSQWLETWSGGGCTHRCDGEVNTLTGEACNPNDPAHKNAKPTTRLSLMLPELDAMGVWRMESHGWNAAAEIPAVAELAQYVGDLVPAVLHLVERRSIKDGKTSRFVVPVLDLRIGVARLQEIVAQKSGTAVELDGPSQARPALAAGPSTLTGTPADTAAERLPTVADIAAASTVEVVFSIYRFLENHGALTDELTEACKVRRAELEPVPDADGAVDAVLVPDADTVWQQVLAAAGQQGMTEADLQDDFALKMDGLSSAEATATELQHYLGLLQTGAAA